MRPPVEVLLPAMKACIVALQIRSAEGISIGPEWSQSWIVAGRIVKFAVALRMIAEAVVGIPCAIFRARTEPLMLGSLDQWRHSVISRRRWRRRWSVISM